MCAGRELIYVFSYDPLKTNTQLFKKCLTLFYLKSASVLVAERYVEKGCLKHQVGLQKGLLQRFIALVAFGDPHGADYG